MAMSWLRGELSSGVEERLFAERVELTAAFFFSFCFEAGADGLGGMATGADLLLPSAIGPVLFCRGVGGLSGDFWVLAFFFVLAGGLRESFLVWAEGVLG